LLQDVDHVVATSTDEVRELEALGMPTGQASVIPCGVDTAGFTPAALHEPGRRVVTVGRMVPRKGYETVIAALALVPGAELVVVGGPPASRLDADPEVARLRGVARSCGVEDRVVFTGAVASDEVARIMRTSDVAATGAWYEPFGIVPVEAMACGLPVVATDVGGHRDTVLPGRTGELVPAKDPEAMAAALRGLLDDPFRRRRYGAAARRRAVELFDWPIVVERTEAVYRALAERAHHLAEAAGS
jgi:glycosyltransferase involved in cell wall biosynthesis